ncbi:RAxF-45 family protein [Chengkuizengella sp. SCS-71B]
MLHSVKGRTGYLSYVYIVRAIFAGVVFNGIRMSIFNKTTSYYRM